LLPKQAAEEIPPLFSFRFRCHTETPGLARGYKLSGKMV
jgi:hypothetical protein